MKTLFQGYYFKHQKENETLCLIVGQSETGRFIQVITQTGSWHASFTGGNCFSAHGIIVNIHTENLSLTGKISYGDLSPIRYDIMGPFQYFPMECSHGVISMRHKLKGSVVLNGRTIDFTDGLGYIEKDGGKSFPSSYTWVQANDFKENCSVMAAVADIPVCIFKFRGCICVIHYKGKEYRLATYLGVRILCCTKEKIVLQQGRYRLVIRICRRNGFSLNAPVNGEMSRNIVESASCPASYTLYRGKEKIFHFLSRHTSFESEWSL